MFRDRTDAGIRLAERLAEFRSDDVLVVGLPRGGVPVAHEVARSLGAPLDVIFVRKLGVPFQPELAMGAIGENGIRTINEATVAAAGITPGEIESAERRERSELERRAERYRADRDRIPLRDRVVLIIDDGIATGSTAKAACQVAAAEGAARVVLAVPVAPMGWTDRLAGYADELIALETPRTFASVGQFYRDFRPTSDKEVVDYLHRPTGRQPAQDRNRSTAREQDIEFLASGRRLFGHLSVPEDARGLVIFAHGSGSSRHSPRNAYVASLLKRAGLATLLFDLLTQDEAHDRNNVFDIGLLSARLAEVTETVRHEPGLKELPVGYFGASTGAAAALFAASLPDSPARAIVSRGGRPDLAGDDHLATVQAPTLLIVGSHDRTVFELNERAKSQMRCNTQIATVAGASHLFEEPGTLQKAAELARDWFLAYFDPRPSPEPTPRPRWPEHVDHYPVG